MSLNKSFLAAEIADEEGREEDQPRDRFNPDTQEKEEEDPEEKKEVEEGDDAEEEDDDEEEEDSKEKSPSGEQSDSKRNARLNRFVEYLRSNVDVELYIHLKLVSLDTKCIPDLPKPYLCCRPTLLIKQLREYVALKMHLKTEEIELLVGRGIGEEDNKATENNNLPVVTSASKDEMQSLEDNETLSRVKVDFISIHDEYLIRAYRKKEEANQVIGA